MIGRYQVFRQRIASELQDVRRAADKAKTAFEAAARGGQDATFYLDAAALNLHGFYNGTERIFEWLARQLDGTVPEGPAWHRDLLEQMRLEVPGVRPPVIRSETQQALLEYLSFRHVVRNVYTWDFVPSRMADLINRLPETMQALDADFEAFRAFLEAAGQADNTGRD